MPKQKTHRASAKRFKKTATGQLTRHHAYTRHRFHGKTVKQRRQLRKGTLVSSADRGRYRQMLSQVK
ncbi:50S ribosomal protein L35 [Agrilactobacillus fermenti]|uniref:50S ribosomal protein L35 n=1 Tax=Agrilactobacillus fermenti TaxID=2586909 RepID=UPI001E3EB811|nr:50S ribosomal protein L35 [Agrilactobacillus fermenti]MCD2256665.1 50S ribosomal protein L35 [Agrilactobacillus fermenti]